MILFKSHFSGIKASISDTKMRVALLHLQKQMTKLELACGPLLATPQHKELKLFSICVVSDLLAYYTFLSSCYSMSVLHQTCSLWETVPFSIPTRTPKCLHFELEGQFYKNLDVLGIGNLNTGYSGLGAPLSFNDSGQLARIATPSSVPTPNRLQRVEPIIFPTVPSLFLDFSHLNGMWMPWFPVPLLIEGSKCHLILFLPFFLSPTLLILLPNFYW